MLNTYIHIKRLVIYVSLNVVRVKHNQKLSCTYVGHIPLFPQCMRANFNITSKGIPVSILLGEYNNIQGQRQKHLEHIMKQQQ